MRRLSLIVLLASAAICSLISQVRPSILFGGAELKLGMSEAELRAAVTEPNQIRVTPEGLLWISQNTPAGEKSLGFVLLREGKVARIQKDWCRETTKSAAIVAESFAAALKNKLAQSLHDSTMAIVKVRSIDVSDRRSETVTIDFGAYIVVIDCIYDKAGDQHRVAVSEYLTEK